MLKQSLQKSTLSNQLKSERRQAKKRQCDLAQEAGISIPTLRLLENGKGSLISFFKVLAILKLELIGRNLPAGVTFGKRLALLRKRRGISQRQLAVLAKVSPPTITALETKQRGRLETLNTVLQVLGAGEHVQPQDTKPSFFTHTASMSLCHTWTTPASLLDKLYSVFGVFDLDPCSPTQNRRHAPVKAKLYFTEADDGLRLAWHGTVFVNPPYGRQLPLWIAKAHQEIQEQHAFCVIALIPARTDTRSWHKDIAGVAHVFLLKGRLAFGQGKESAPFPSALVVWGGDDDVIVRLQQQFPSAWYVAASSRLG